MSVCIHIPWYATGFRKEDLGAALQQISEISLRYGAQRYAVYESNDDLYRFLQVLVFDSKRNWENFWYGGDFADMRAACQGWYQVPVLYTYQDIVAEGQLEATVDAPGATF
jgi:hypothetical protein